MKETIIPKGQNGAPNGHIMFVPNDFDASNRTKKYPTLYWLHGQGELGEGSVTSLGRVSGTGFIRWMRQNEVPFIVIAPQYLYNGATITPFVRWSLDKYQQIGGRHMQGLSMGGYVLRDFIIEDSDVFRTFSTFTASATNLDMAASYADRIVKNDQYIWAHAGQNDGGANQPGALARFIKAVQKIDPKRGLLTIYESMGHSAWEEVYDSSGRDRKEIAATGFDGVELFKWLSGQFTWWEWMLQHDKGAKNPPVDPPTDPEPVKDPVTELPYLEGENLVFTTKSGKTVKLKTSG